MVPEASAQISASPLSLFSSEPVACLSESPSFGFLSCYIKMIILLRTIICHGLPPSQFTGGMRE